MIGALLGLVSYTDPWDEQEYTWREVSAKATKVHRMGKTPRFCGSESEFKWIVLNCFVDLRDITSTSVVYVM